MSLFTFIFLQGFTHLRAEAVFDFVRRTPFCRKMRVKTPPLSQTGTEPEVSDRVSSLTLDTDCAAILYSGGAAVDYVESNAQLNREMDQWNERLQRVRAMRFDGLRFLLVDDSPDNQKLFQRILVAAGATVDIAENGGTAVECFRSNPDYDLIVMDIRMPIVDGYEATRQIRALGFVRPIVALTAHATPGEEEKCRSAGCSDFKLKPIDRLSLLTAVSQAIAKISE